VLYLGDLYNMGWQSGQPLTSEQQAIVDLDLSRPEDVLVVTAFAGTGEGKETKEGGLLMVDCVGVEVDDLVLCVLCPSSSSSSSSSSSFKARPLL